LSVSLHKWYSQLLAALRQGERAALISRYGSDGSIDKQVVNTGTPDAWRELEELLAQPGMATSGPVASMVAQDGSLTVVERYSTKPRLLILGGGHIALALASIGKLIDFEVVVYDDRLSFANTERFPQANQVICDGFDHLMRRLGFRTTDYVVIVTRGHRHDFTCLEAVLTAPRPAYTGMIGSKRRVAIVMGQLKEAGFDEQRLADIHAPIGLRIGALTPAEIAISILAEIIAVKRLERADDAYGSCDLTVIEALSNSPEAAEAMVTIYGAEGSVPIDTGAKLAMTYEGNSIGTVGGGCSEAEAMQIARDVIRTGGWRTHTIDLTDSAEEDGMVCGGKMRVIIERL
jgi:xanthine dehydrogenase accessory factor